MKKSYTTWDIIKGFKIPRERFRQWLDLGFIKPSIQIAKGVRTKNLFSREDVFHILLFDELIKHGVSRTDASVALKYFSKDYPKLIKNLFPDDERRIKEAEGVRGARWLRVITESWKDEHEIRFKADQGSQLNLDDFGHLDSLVIINLANIRAKVDALG